MKIKQKYIIREEWMTPGLLNYCRQKDTIHKKYLRNRNEENYNKFIQYRNKYNNLKK